MSLLPLIFGDSWTRPQYGFDPDELVVVSRPKIYIRPWASAASRKDTGSIISSDSDKFQANLDVQQFLPEEIAVKVSGNQIIIEGKHEEKEDEHGFIFRHFVRKYILPEGYDVNQVKSKISSDGVLCITAPKVDTKNGGEKREIHIQQTGKPAKVQEEKKEKKK